MSIHQLARHPKTFMQSNAVWVSGQLNVKGRGKAEIWPVTLQRAANVACLSPTGAEMPCWEVVPATSLGDHELAYFLPWAPNSTKSMTLGTKAKLFLTDSMNGCSFAGAGGTTPLVAHVNYNVDKEEGKPIDQAFMDSEIQRLFPTSTPKTLKKADYVTDSFPNVTLIGRLLNNQWKFVYQKRNYINATAKKNYQLVSVHYIR